MSAFALAQSAVEASEAEVAILSKDVDDLKAEFALQDQQEEPLAVPQEVLQATSKQLEELLKALTEGGGISEQHLEQAKAYSQQLIQGFKTCFEAVTHANADPVHRRLRRKSDAASLNSVGPVMTEYRPVRHLGKQEFKTRPKDVFSSYSKEAVQSRSDGSALRRETSV